MKKRYRLLLCIGIAMLLSGCTVEKSEDAIVEDCVEGKSDSEENKTANECRESTEESRMTSIHTLAVKADKKYSIVRGEYYGTEMDYKLYIFEKGDDNYDNPIYTFPDVRDKNVAIGEYHDMYFIDQRDINSDGMIDIFSVARYMIDGELYYDTRVYMGNGLEFIPDYEYMNELNSTYYATEEDSLDYPIWEILYGVEQELREESQSAQEPQTWQSAYLEIICHLQDYLVPLYEPNGTDTRCYDDPNNQEIYLGLHDFDEDGMMELIAGDTWALAVFTYKDGQVEKIEDLYYPDVVWCVNGVYFKDNSISVVCSGAGGSDFVNFGYQEGEYVLGLYSEINMPSVVMINGKESNLEEMNRIYTLNWDERSEAERKEWIRMVNENGTWIFKDRFGEKLALDINDFDFNLIMW